jgi:NAD(P)-dependent dehydrogenase (short-subunit alcohol dehydrogenase family)
LLFTGATGSLRGGALFSAFASSKFALRALAQSLAREFGPQGVHVSHVIIDAVIDTPATAAWKIGNGEKDSKISPESIAESYWFLHNQPKDSWTQEMDLRPYQEKF